MEFTPTQEKILTVLSDGMNHKREELRSAIGDSQTTLDNLQVHLVHLRKKLRPIGQDIVCVLNGAIYYRHVRVFRAGNDD